MPFTNTKSLARVRCQACIPDLLLPESVEVREGLAFCRMSAQACSYQDNKRTVFLPIYTVFTDKYSIQHFDYSAYFDEQVKLNKRDNRKTDKSLRKMPVISKA
jgi:hypothetical protein